MDFKKIWKWIRISYGLLFIAAVVIGVVVVSFFLSATLVDREALTNTATMSTISIILGILALPGILVQLLSLLDINQPKTYTLTCKCPNCRQLVDMKMIED